MRYRALLALLLFAPALVSLKGVQNRPPVQVNYPDVDIGVESLPARAKAQLDTVNQFKVFYQFHFSDKVEESAITFVQRIVEDAGRHYKAVHYDHGGGLAVAEVDGDGLYDIYFVNQVGGSELWKNLGGKFKNITKGAGVGLPGRISAGASFADIDNDGDQDLFVTTVRGGNALFENDGHGHFKDISKEAGVDLVAHSSGVVWLDYDNDGLVDLLVTNIGKYTSEDDQWPDGSYVGLVDAFDGQMYPERFEYPVLYKNMGHNHFKNVTDEVGLHPRGWSGDATFTDLNGDGWSDLFFLNMQGHSHYLENEGGKKFVDRTGELFPKTPWGAMGIKFFDYDNDGRMDPFVTDMHSDMQDDFVPEREKLKLRPEKIAPVRFLGGNPTTFMYGNALYHNLGGGIFEEVSDRMGVEMYWPWGVSVGDVNADGWDDIFVSAGMSFPYRYGINSMLLNNRGEKFLDAEFLLGIEPRRGGRTYTPWFDIDCSQQEQLAGLNKAVCAGQTGPITVMAALASRSSVIFDLDNDGDLDIVTNDFNSAPQVLISDLAQLKPIHWLKVVLVGTTSNRDGLGATVRMRAGGHVFTKYNDGKSGYLSQSSLPLYFGLGDAKEIERVEVDWPSGRKQVVSSGLGENQTLNIVEPK